MLSITVESGVHQEWYVLVKGVASRHEMLSLLRDDSTAQMEVFCGSRATICSAGRGLAFFLLPTLLHLFGPHKSTAH